MIGLNIFQNDDAGLQLNIGGRGLDPNRTSNFNTRQNGYDISADVLGYPESYYTPPSESLEEIQIVRGAASLQYGTQFGGLVNFITKSPKPNTELEVVSRNTLGSFGLYTNFTSVSGTKNKLSYYGYVNFKKGDGFRPNSEFNSKNAFKNAHVIIDFSVPKCTLAILKIASLLKKRVVIGTTGFSNKEEKLIKKYSRKIPILKAGNMSLGVNLLVYLTEIASRSLGNSFLNKVFEVHHKHKKDHPSGTALMLGKGIAVGKNKDFSRLVGKKYLNKKSFPYGKKINFNSLRKGLVIGKHEVSFSSGKEIISLNHEAFDRALFADGALTAARWIIGKKPGLYSMRNVLNFR